MEAASPSPAHSPARPSLPRRAQPPDLASSGWKLLANSGFASVVVSHDRYFLDAMVNDMAEIDRPGRTGIAAWGKPQPVPGRRSFSSPNPTARGAPPASAARWDRLRRRTGKSEARIDEAAG
jgi:hypothetical protein